MSFLEDMYYGYIHPVDQKVIQESEYVKFCHKLNKQCGSFSEKLNKDDAKEFNEILNQTSQLSDITSFENYMPGFRHGAKMIIETLFGESENFKPSGQRLD